MERSAIFHLLIALASGLAIGTQSSLNSAAGRLAGSTLTGLLVNLAGGVASGIILAALYIQSDARFLTSVRGTTLMILITSGLLGVAIIAGIAYALPKVGVAAGLAAIIVGQMIVAVIVDAFGLVGGQPIPLDGKRLGGLALLALGTWTILPRG